LFRTREDLMFIRHFLQKITCMCVPHPFRMFVMGNE
jgi:hypothetical protein